MEGRFNNAVLPTLSWWKLTSNVEEIFDKLAERYRISPWGWRIILGRDLRGYQDIVIVHEKERTGWRIKREYINPFEDIGVVREIPSIERVNIPRELRLDAGVRIINQDQLKVLFTAEKAADIVKLLRKIPPTVPKGIKPGSYLVGGPIIYTGRRVDELIPGAREVDEELREELEKLLRRRPERFLRYL